MRSALPKVLHQVGNRAMLDHAIDTAEGLGAAKIVVVVGTHAPEVGERALRRLGPGSTAVQDPPMGTAHAVLAAEAALGDFSGDVLVTYADAPLIGPEAVAPLRQLRALGAGIAVLGFEARNPTGYGRLIEDAAGTLLEIIEEKHASPAQKVVRRCNSGVIVADRGVLFHLLSMVPLRPEKNEYYLTDVIGLGRSAGFKAQVAIAEEAEVLGCNSRAELAAAEAYFQQRMRARAMAAGVTLIDPATVYFSHDTQLGEDVVVEPGVYFGPGVTVANGVRIKAFSHLEGASIGPNCQVGPFVRLRPGAELSAKVKIGNFVEIKNARFGEGAQASHLTYVGDADVGARANLGCGTITCNYDGFDKYRTVIGPDAFIGSDTALVAPVTIGAGAYTGSGSVITKDVPDGALAIGRSRQRDVPGWAETFRARKRAAKHGEKA
jgi:bifunctional UDP-N-acetylglucosamine pyrophosphorylase/glucosamine-1-phosphate N-acetyltransferase